MNFNFFKSLLLHAIVLIVGYFGFPSAEDKKIVTESTRVVTVELLAVTDITNVQPPKNNAKKKQEEEKPTPRKSEVKDKVIKEVEKPKEELKAPKPAKVEKPKPKEPTPKKEAPKPTPPKKEPPKPKAPEEPKKLDQQPKFKPKPTSKPKQKERPKEIVKKKEEKKPEPKKPEPVKEPEEPKPTFDSVLKSIEDIEAQQKIREAKEARELEERQRNVDLSAIENFISNTEQENNFKPGPPLSLNEKDAIRQQIMRNWSVPSGAKGARDLTVEIEIKMAKDGTVTSAEIMDTRRYGRDSFYRAMADSARRAVYKSSPLQNLPVAKYDVRDGWRQIRLNFDPSEMFY